MSLDLLTYFYEAKLDYCMYDEKGERAPAPTEGKHHFQ